MKEPFYVNLLTGHEEESIPPNWETNGEWAKVWIPQVKRKEWRDWGKLVVFKYKKDGKRYKTWRYILNTEKVVKYKKHLARREAIFMKLQRTEITDKTKHKELLEIVKDIKDYFFYERFDPRNRENDQPSFGKVRNPK